MEQKSIRSFVPLIILALLSNLVALAPAQATTAGFPADNAATQLSETYGQLPIGFEANCGQFDQAVLFRARGAGCDLFLTTSEAIFAVLGSEHPETPLTTRAADVPSKLTANVVRMQMRGASPQPSVEGLEELPGRSNYFSGSQPSEWLTDVASFAKVIYGSVYPGIDLVYYGSAGQLEYDFEVAPGADPAVIQLTFDGVDELAIDDAGDLRLQINGGHIVQRKPLAYQLSLEGRRPIAARYSINETGKVGFEIGDYDATKPLIIDPVIAYSTYLGGSGDDEGNGIAVDREGNAYVTGYTLSADFPVAGALQGHLHPGTDLVVKADVFVAKLNQAGNALIYSTYLGGSSHDFGNAIAVDSNGNACVVGYTYSDDFPTANALFPTNPPTDFYENGFVAKLNAAGNALLYSTYLGGTYSDQCKAIAIDPADNVYVTGFTGSSDFPTMHALFPNSSSQDAFVTKINATGSAVIYSTFLGGTPQPRGGRDSGQAIAADAAGNAYVTGRTFSENFPTTPNAYRPKFTDDLSLGFDVSDAFVTKLNPSGSALVYSTYLGGSGDDEGTGIAVDASGSAFVTGRVQSIGFPTTPAAFQKGYAGPATPPAAFVTKFTPAGDALVYSTFIDGNNFDIPSAIALDAEGNSYVVGGTTSSNFPIANPVQAALGGSDGDSDAFVVRLNQAGSDLSFSTYFGGMRPDAAHGLAIDAGGSIYIVGSTSSTNLSTFNAMQASAGGGHSDAFIAKIAQPDRNPGAAAIISPHDEPSLRCDRPMIIRFSGADPDGVSGFLISYSLDDGLTYHDIARVAADVNEVIWNPPGPIVANVRFRVMTIDRLGNATTGLSKSFLLSPSVLLLPPTLKVSLSFAPPPAGEAAPPQNLSIQWEEVPSTRLPLSPIEIVNRSVFPPKLAGYNVYRVALPPNGQPPPTADQITTPANLIGSVDIDATSFTDFVPTNVADNFAYAVVSFFGEAGSSSSSPPVSTQNPAIINPVWENNTLHIDARGSLISATGATLLVNSRESYPLELDATGTFFRVPKSAIGSPSGKRLKKVIKPFRDVFIAVRNPDGKQSVYKIFTRIE
jgi:hypothetical protein